jgi:hypothetical protein
MDICCPNCGELWDSYHIRYDEASEWGLSEFHRDAFLESGRFSSPNDKAYVAAEEAGWRFATMSMFSFVRCPCCKGKEPLRNAARRQETMRALAETLDGDDDALVIAAGDALRLD